MATETALELCTNATREVSHLLWAYQQTEGAPQAQAKICALLVAHSAVSMTALLEALQSEAAVTA